MFYNIKELNNEEASYDVCIISFLAIVVDLFIIIYYSL